MDVCEQAQVKWEQDWVFYCRPLKGHEVVSWYCPQYCIAGTEIRRSDSIRILGVEFDACMSMSAYIASLCKSINFHLRNIARIRRFIDRATCERVICSLVTSRLDYANSLIYGINKTDLTKLQRLQNRAARLIVGASRRESALPLLTDLHWLPVRERLEFKALTHVHKCIHNSDQSPLYLQQLHPWS